MSKPRVGQIGIGGIGRVHFGCYGRSEQAELVAICDIDPRKLEGDWSLQGFNLGSQEAKLEDLSGYRRYADWNEMLKDPGIDIIDICLPISQHAEAAIAALRAGKHVICEKPMARTSAACREMEAAAAESGKQLMIGHCLRYWPEYIAAQEIIASGKYGKPLYARLGRSTGTPKWSYQNWLRVAEESGGCLLDMHVHDVDAALWWFGKPASIDADGIFLKDLPSTVDATWKYEDGLRVYLHNSWDDNETPFWYMFSVMMEKGTISYDSQMKEPKLRLYTEEGSSVIEVESASAYQREIDDFAACVGANRIADRVRLDASREAVEAVEEETRQIYAKNGRS